MTLISRYITGAARIHIEINRVLDRYLDMDSGYKPVTLNSLPVHPFCRVPGVTYSDATSVLYTARLVRRALRMQPTVR